MKSKYISELQKVVNGPAEPLNPNGPSREETLRIIEDISVQLNGPLSNTERILLFADRKAARDHLAALDAFALAATEGRPYWN